MRTHLVVLLAKPLHHSLLLAPLAAGGCAISCFSVRCIRSCLPFCSGCPASIRSATIPSFIHHTASRDKPAMARRCKRRPIVGSDRLRHAILAKRRFKDRLHSRRVCLLHRLAAQQIPAVRICDRQADRSVSPSPVRNQPLKSAHHTRFGPSACASGSLYGAVRRRFRRATINPSRFNSAPIVLAAGHTRPGSLSSSTRFNFRGPHRLCASRSSNTFCSISAGVWFPCRCAARLFSLSPSNPTA